MISTNSEGLTVETTSIVKKIKGINIATEEGMLLIEPEITLDFKDIPEKYHELCLRILQNI